jgi:hypothetical protein
MMHPGVRRGALLTTAALVALLCCVLFWARRPVHAQTPTPPGYTVMAAGWNLISSGPALALSVPSATVTLYTLQPGDAAYETASWRGLRAGVGYWAYFNENTALRLPPSSIDSYAVDLPARQWVMVGNPSTTGSVRVAGADAVYVFSSQSGYRQDNLIPVGYGAFVFSFSGARVSLDLQSADRTQVDFAACCTIGPGQYGGKAHLDIVDDTTYALFFGVRAVGADGTFPLPIDGNYAYGLVQRCGACADYAAAPSSCRSSANVRSVEVDPGTYLIRLTTDASRVPDIILRVPLQANMHYFLGRWVAAARQ